MRYSAHLNGLAAVLCKIWLKIKMLQKYGGEGGIRTHGTSRYNGFQDRLFRPLRHLSI